MPIQTQRRYLEQRKRCVRTYRLSDAALEADVRFCLSHLYWSPKQISSRFKLEKAQTIETSTIYRALDSGLLRDTLRYYLRFKYKKTGKAKKKDRRCYARRIEESPAEANDRSEFGHWEGDHFVSHKGKPVDSYPAVHFPLGMSHVTSSRVKTKRSHSPDFLALCN